MSVLFVILLATVFASYQAIQQPLVLDRLLYVPYRVKHLNGASIFTHALVHADYTHLVNAFVLWQFECASKPC